MKIVIFGGSGLIGSRLTEHFHAQGFEVIVVSRSGRQTDASSVRHISWQQLEEDRSDLERADAFINLAGETINQRWTAEAKRNILDSRLWATGKVTEFVRQLENKPNVVINGSAIGIYGVSGTEVFDETSPVRTDDFLSGVVAKWEKAADAMAPYTRLVKLRIGVVLAKQGGALPKMMLPYKLYIGGRIGSGSQWISWIHIDDLAGFIQFCIEREQISGAVNGTAPHPVTNDAFGRSLGKAMGRPHAFPVPAPVLRILLGEMSALVLEGQRVLPQAAAAHGYVFRYPVIDQAIAALLLDGGES